MIAKFGFGIPHITMLGAFIIISIMLVLPVVGHTKVPQQGQVEGDVVQVFSNVIVIRDDQGQTTILQLTTRTQMSTTLKAGDKVIAYITPYGVTSVQPKQNTATMIP